MSHLRAPADRRSPQQRRQLPPLGTQLSRIAVLPPVAVALGGGAAVLFVLRTAGTPAGPALWAVLAGALALAVVAVAAAAVAARRAAHSVAVRVEEIRRRVAEQTEERRAAAGESATFEAPDAAEDQACASGPGGPAADAFGRLADDLERAHRESLETLSRRASETPEEAATVGGGDRGAGVEHRIEVFVNVARRLQSLAHREIAVLDELEREIEDPDLLKGLFHVDHLATRVRRHAENLAVLGGAVSRRQWSEPVALEEVLRSAVAEVEQYARVRVVPPVDGTLRGHAVADVIHLLAELVENATVFSPPHTQVAIRADAVAVGLAVEVEDRGLGMPSEEQERMNALLADPATVDVAGLLADGRIGLYVVSQLARRHGVRVRLGSNIYGGVQAVLVLPQELLGPLPVEPSPAAEDAPVNPPTAGGPAGTGERRLPGPASHHGERPGADADAEGPGSTPGLVAPVSHGTLPEAADAAWSGPVPGGSGPGVDGPGEGGQSPVVMPGPGPGPEPLPDETVLFSPAQAADPALRENADRRPSPGNASAVERAGAHAGGPEPGPYRPVTAQDSSAGLPFRGEARGDGAYQADGPWGRTPDAGGRAADPLAPAEHAPFAAPDDFAAESPTPPPAPDPWRSLGDAPADRPAAAPSSPATTQYEGGAGHLDRRTAWPEPQPEPSPEPTASAEALVRGPGRNDVAGRPGDEDAWPGALGTARTAPQGPGEDSPAQSGRPDPGALPEAWRQATRPAEETPPLPSPRHDEHVAPHAGPRASLPVRERDGRATPAGALPGMRSAAPAGGPTGPRVPPAQEPVAGPPPLPRRRAQSHLAPQLRSRPTPRPEADAVQEETGHDPQLMAAFRRGVGLAEAHDTPFPGAEAHAETGQGAETAGTAGTAETTATGGRGNPADL